MYDINVVGHLTIDILSTNCGAPRIRTPGGSSFYTSLATSILGLNTKVTSTIGLDFPTEYLVYLRNHRVDTSFIHVCKEPTTKFELIYTDSKRILKIIDVCAPILYEDYLDNKFHAIHFGPVINEIEDELYEHLSKKNSFLSLDVQGLLREIAIDGQVYLQNHQNLVTQYSRKCDLIKIAEEELYCLTGRQDFKPALQSIKRFFRGKMLLITRGRFGSILITPQMKGFQSPAYPVSKVYDPTGAGDTLIGGFLSSILKEEESEYALAVGTAAASYCVEKKSGNGFFLGHDFEERVKHIYSQITPVR